MRAATLSFPRQVLFLVPLVLILPMFMGLDGVLYAGPIADGCAAVLSAVFISIEMRRLGRMEKSRPLCAVLLRECRQRQIIKGSISRLPLRFPSLRSLPCVSPISYTIDDNNIPI